MKIRAYVRAHFGLDSTDPAERRLLIAAIAVIAITVLTPLVGLVVWLLERYAK